MGRKASKKPLRADAIDEKSPPVVAAVAMHLSASGILETPAGPGAFSTTVPFSDPRRVTGFANPSLKQNLGPWFYPGPSIYHYGFDENGCGSFSEEQFEVIVINYLDCIYNEVISRLVSFGYDAALALRAVLCKGHCFGTADALSNIMQNALEYLNTVSSNTADVWKAPAGAFSDLRHLEEYSLAVMVCLLQQIRADLSRSEAMWCLLMSGFRVRLASSFKFPSFLGILQEPGPPGSLTPGSVLPFPGRRRQMEVEEEAKELVQLVLKRLEAMRIEDEKREDKELQDEKTEMIMELIRLIRKLEDQVKATKQWAQEKVIQAVLKLGGNTQALMVLRAELEENQRAVNEMPVLGDSTMDRRAEMESVLNKARKQVDRVSTFVKKLETENSDITAETEASKVCELIERETKCLQNLMACLKETETMQEEITEKRKKIVPVQQQLAEVQEATKQAEVTGEYGIEKMLLKTAFSSDS